MPSKIIKGDKVIVVTGKDKGKTGEVIQIFTKSHKALVSGINMSIKHTKQSEKNAGGRIPKEAQIHISNLALMDPKSNIATKVGFKLVDGKKIRFAKKSGELIKSYISLILLISITFLSFSISWLMGTLFFFDDFFLKKPEI